MFGLGKLSALLGVLLLDVAHLVSSGVVFSLIGGIVAVGALQQLARAWRGERDAAVAKAERLSDDRIADLKLMDELRAKVARLETETNVKLYAEQSSAEHKAILDGLTELTNTVRAMTTALEFIAKQRQLNADLEGGLT